MKRFAVYSEATEYKNLHLDHLEDSIFDGQAGTDFAFQLLKEFGDALSDGTVSKNLNISTKWDGSPAIVFGRDPVDGQFFVATKAAFSITPKLAKSHEAINELYPIRPVADILHVAFDELAELHPGLVLQGDVLFTKATVTQQTINETDYITFQPNTLLYGVEAGSEMARKISAANLGLALHTSYVGTGTTLAQSSAVNLSPETFASLRQSENVFLLDANFDDVSGQATFTEDESADFQLALDTAESFHVGTGVYETVSQEPLRQYLHRFVNHTVRQGWDLNGVESVDNFLIYLIRRQEEEQSSKVTLAGQQSVRHKFEQMRSQVTQARYGDTIRDTLSQWFELHQALARAKTVIIRKLEVTPTLGVFTTFIATEQGWEPSGPEGFVVSTAQKAVKLVDRPRFSRQNFAHGRPGGHGR